MIHKQKNLKHLVGFLIVGLITTTTFAQTNLITGINISIPSNPDANIAEWAKAMPPFMISAQTRLEQGKVSHLVMDSQILVSIKGSGGACGSFTKANAPESNFNSASKVWSGQAALDLLGHACVLKPGSYELCVQFFSEGAAGKVLIGEACKSFTIKETEHLSYQPPQLLAPADGSELKDSDLKKPMTFKWTPLLPKTTEPVTYRLKVWQLMQVQTGTQAMKANQPIFTKDVENMTQVVVNKLIDGPCKLPYLCNFVWNVQALNREGNPIGSNNGTSEVFTFSANSCDVNLALKLKSIECLPPTHGFNNYKICISSTYTSPNYNLTYSGSTGLKAYAPTYAPFYAVSNITPVLQVQNSGATTTVNYCFNVSVPTGQTSIKIGLQGDDKDPGPMICQPGAELDVRLPDCTNPTCECGAWSPLTVLDAAQGKRYDCGSTIEWTCKQALNFTASYQCSPNDKTCEASTTWDIKKGAIVIKSGTGTNQLNDGFSLLENGTYTLTLNASCNGKACPPCTYTIIVRDCKNCDCGSWDTLLVNRVKYECNNEKPIKWTCNKPIEFSNSYHCSPNDETCQARTNWEVKKDGQNFSTGTGSSGEFTPTANGTYTLTLHANCNGKECRPCVTTFIVEDCRCDCGEWGSLTVPTATGNKTYPCGIKMLIPWSCKQAFNFTDTYQCSPNNESCQANTTWKVEKGSNLINSGSGTNTLNGTFTPTENGIYTITLEASCNGVKCKTCVYQVNVTDCCQTSEIIIKKKKITIPNDGSCLKPGDYSFNLNITPSTPPVTGTYVLTSTPNNTTVSSGNFTSGVPLNLIIPQYVCGSVTGFKLTYTWNHGRCSSSIERTICPPPCCDNITVGKTSLNLVNTDLYFNTQFLIAAPPVTFTKVKVQILDIDDNGGAKPWANILSIEETSVPWGLSLGNTNTAITAPGSAIWFNYPLSPVLAGPLTFEGKIINFYFPPSSTSPINLIVRFTFYQNNGTCDDIICEKDINYNKEIGPKK